MSKLQDIKMAKRPLASEPSVNTGLSVTIAAGVLYLLNHFFPNFMNENVETAVYAIVAIAIPIVTALLIRRKVWSPQSVAEVIKEAVTAAEDTIKQRERDKLQLLTKLTDRQIKVEGKHQLPE